MSLSEINKMFQTDKEAFLEEISSTVAEVGIPHAKVQASIYKNYLHSKAGISVTKELDLENFKIFSFFVWACAYGIWGDIQDPGIRNRLIYDTYVKVASGAAYVLSSDKSISDIVALTNEMQEQYELTSRALFVELPILFNKGYPESVETLLLVGLRWLQKFHAVDNATHEKIENAFFKNQRVQEGLTEIEHIAFLSSCVVEGKVV